MYIVGEATIVPFSFHKGQLLKETICSGSKILLLRLHSCFEGFARMETGSHKSYSPLKKMTKNFVP